MRKQNIREGLAYVAKSYGMGERSGRFADALGLKSQQTLQGIMDRGSTKQDTLSQIVEKTWVSLDWLTTRRGKAFPNGLNQEFGGATTIAELEKDIDVLRNTCVALATMLAVKLPGADGILNEALENAPYGDRGFYQIVREEMEKAVAASRAESSAAERPSVARRAGTRR